MPGWPPFQKGVFVPSAFVDTDRFQGTEDLLYPLPEVQLFIIELRRFLHITTCPVELFFKLPDALLVRTVFGYQRPYPSLNLSKSLLKVVHIVVPSILIRPRANSLFFYGITG